MHLHHGRAILWLFLLGATLGTALDAFHVYSHVEQYTKPAFFWVAWWVPFLFGSAAVAIGYSHPLVDPLIHNIRPPRRISTSIAELGWRSEEHTSELQSQSNLVCRLLLEKKKINKQTVRHTTTMTTSA